MKKLFVTLCLLLIITFCGCNIVLGNGDIISSNEPSPTPPMITPTEPSAITTASPVTVSPEVIITESPIETESPTAEDDLTLKVVTSDGKELIVTLGMTKEEVDRIIDESGIVFKKHEPYNEVSGWQYIYSEYYFDSPIATISGGYNMSINNNNDSGEWIFDAYSIFSPLITTNSGLRVWDEPERIEEIYGSCKDIEENIEGWIGYTYVFDKYEMHITVGARDDKVVVSWTVVQKLENNKTALTPTDGIPDYLVGSWIIDYAKIRSTGEDYPLQLLYGTGIIYGGTLQLNSDATFSRYIGITTDETDNYEGTYVVNDNNITLNYHNGFTGTAEYLPLSQEIVYGVYGTDKIPIDEYYFKK